MNRRKIAASFLCALIIAATASSPTSAYIKNLLIESPPIPTRSPLSDKQDGHSSSLPEVSPGDQGLGASEELLKEGLAAVSRKRITEAVQIRDKLPLGSLPRKTLSWAIALSGHAEISFNELMDIANSLQDWPGQRAIQINAENALANESPEPTKIIQYLEDNPPVSVTGKALLAEAYLARGKKTLARQILIPVWHEELLDETMEKDLLSRFANVLQVADHRIRMHRMFYNGNITAGERMGSLAEQSSLAKAWAAVLKRNSDATEKIDAVAASSQSDIAYRFIKIEQARRNGEYRKAAELLAATSEEPKQFVDQDEWWNERRIVSRQMLEFGDAETAYRIASNHSARSPAKIAEAEFHAGWYALRFLKDKSKAKLHFAKLLDVTSQPISQARGHYWMARSSSGEDMTRHYELAAMHTGTFYGQLASNKLGRNKISIQRPSPTHAERIRYRSRELVRVIRLLESTGFAWRADSIYRYLGRTLDSSGELALLAHDAETQGKHMLALQIGKLAHVRRLHVDTLAWPKGAIPPDAKTGKTGLALAYAIARQESAFDRKARSHAGALGLLQLLPGTARKMAKDLGLRYSQDRLASDASYNVTLGSAYLSKQLEEFDGSYVLTLAAYNAGPGRVREWIARFGDPREKSLDEIIDWIEFIPFTETRNYVQRVMENYQVYKIRTDRTDLTIATDLEHGRR